MKFTRWSRASGHKTFAGKFPDMKGKSVYHEAIQEYLKKDPK